MCAQRSSLSFDGKGRASVDVECYIGTRRVAIEHTLIEPYENKTLEDTVITGVLDLVVKEAATKNLVPPMGTYFLMVKGGTATKIMKSEFQKVTKIVLDWLPEAISKVGNLSGLQSVSRSPDAAIPFEVTIRRVSGAGPGKMMAARSVPDDLEIGRKERVKRALDRKLPKLEACCRNGAYAVLILEDQDIAISNHQLISGAVDNVLAGQRFSPDEIFLMNTYAGVSKWAIWVLRRGNQSISELVEQGQEILFEFEPSSLVDITEDR